MNIKIMLELERPIGGIDHKKWNINNAGEAALQIDYLKSRYAKVPFGYFSVRILKNDIEIFKTYNKV